MIHETSLRPRSFVLAKRWAKRRRRDLYENISFCAARNDSDPIRKLFYCVDNDRCDVIVGQNCIIILAHVLNFVINRRARTMYPEIRFIPQRPHDDVLYTLHFVYTQRNSESALAIQPLYYSFVIELYTCSQRRAQYDTMK
jgi:hypothetical protein